MTGKQGIIFDMDGTLWDSAAQVAKSWSQVVAEQYSPEKVITEKDLQSVMGLTMDKLAQALFPELQEQQRMELLEACCQTENEYLRKNGGSLYPDVEETLKILQKKYPLYIVSNCQSGYIEAFLEYYRFEDYFQDIECFGNNGLKKGENIRKVVERNALEDAVYVGDIQGDFDASAEAGIKFIHAAYGFGNIRQQVASIQKFSELPQIIESLIFPVSFSECLDFH